MSQVALRTAPLDHETRVGSTDPGAVRLWLRLLTCTNIVEAAIRARLRTSFRCTLPRFDLMAHLERHPEGLKMGELSRRLMVTGGNVTGVTDQLVKEGLVTRQSLPADRRACVVKLTPSGTKAFRRMAQVHEQWVTGIFSHLSERERRQLHVLLGVLKTRLPTTTKEPQ